MTVTQKPDNTASSLTWESKPVVTALASAHLAKVAEVYDWLDAVQTNNEVQDLVQATLMLVQ